ncbi:hypothetical protein FAD_0523 [Ferroplasma acidiphilum]|uniref:Uncharacterized protein n=3 Tax=Ferroplasmaceae TaxID=90142 RepID=S0ARU0_FERAC|nr:hypothetical protein [Ferroplasma sp.]AGO61522.1 hypothetical protein FACI_IFERC00001G1542 [Ferroplasma acidarmanus Fer1]ARD84437.1 hypothetical protein FAD_0523 [Ferroplasma acidiphilum]
MIYIIIRREISKYLVTKISCDHMFDKIERLDDNEVIIDFLLVYYISNEFIDAYIANRHMSMKHIVEKNIPLSMKKLLSQQSEL